jgi:beta-fructofuranosidase
MILFISHNLGCQYYIGRYANDHFTPEQHGRMTWVDNEFFAPESLADGHGRRIMWAWVFDRRDAATRKASGWSGEMSLPRILWLGEDGSLRMRPVSELQQLRYNPRIRQHLVVPADSELQLDEIRSNSLELAVEMMPGPVGQCGVQVCCSPGGEEQTVVGYRVSDHQLIVDTRRSSLKEGTRVVEAAPFVLRPGEPLQLRVFVDKSIVEVFANDRQAVVRRIYPSRPDSLGVALFSEGGETRVRSVAAWEMAPSNPW